MTRTRDEVAPFEEFMGSHGGLRAADHPFAAVAVERAAAPIVGVEAMHAALDRRRWAAGEPARRRRATRARPPRAPRRTVLLRAVSATAASGVATRKLKLSSRYRLHDSPSCES